jgi:dihydroorotate dehydrogenase (fumarate)
MTTSALLRNGSGQLAVMEAELVSELAERGYDSIDELRGSMSHRNLPDPAGFERVNYMRTLSSWSSRHPVSPGQAALLAEPGD